MTRLPSVIASAVRPGGLALTVFEGAHQENMRDALGYYFRYRGKPDSEERRLAVLFSGTVYSVKLGAFGIMEVPEVEDRFRVFAHACIGDFLDDTELDDLRTTGDDLLKLECFSPHFQSWRDRERASDEQIEQYLESHAFEAWHYALPGWEVGLADQLRLRRSFSHINRLISLGDGTKWTVKARTDTGAILVATRDFIQARRTSATPAALPAMAEQAQLDQPSTEDGTPPQYVFVDESRISELKRLASTAFDFSKVIALCEELNICYRSQCYYSVASLVRTLLDHVPPVFGMNSFAAVANNYDGGKSFKDIMSRLDRTARVIGDMHLHTQIRSAESLPTRTQINFASEVDVLLSEMIRVSSSRRP